MAKFIFRCSASLLSLFIFGSPPLFAQNGEVPNNTLVRIGDTPLASTDYNDFRTYMQQLIERRLAQKFTRTMEAKRFDSKEIQDVLESPQFKNYAQRVSHHPKVTVAIERFLTQLATTPAAATAETALESPEAAERTLALKHFYFENRISGTGYAKKEVPSWFQRLWNQARAYLLE